ncbi:fumarase, class II [Desulfacinum hydrothermale DSM 13146]|uniref:Fumarate hydratase class II n=1 Tax=Desulfacinum hydrothermale DSM 13146 TaxID=1121390 RepID=A0A1W1XFX8_9BACT|nr:class II fumarate hydratase [Desulfacinum hydrothermale]SMC22883.1 fumarase, class II [Desulfacinum hydrothermale DSM 13146]
MVDGMRVERDSLGQVRVPASAYYGAQTQRAVDNFGLGGVTMPREILRVLALIKEKAAQVHREAGRLDPKRADAIAQAARELVEGRHWDQFPVDVYQTGSGTSTNMNMNEVVAGRANEILTGRRGGREPVHPNDHVNLGQSSNDVIPTSIRMAAWLTLRDRCLPALRNLQSTLEEKAREFADVVKIGRTHLQDALPVTLGQEFCGYARQVELGCARLQGLEDRLCQVPLGGTAVGTGVGAPAGFARAVLEAIRSETNARFREAADHFEAQGSQDTLVEASGMVRTVAVSLSKIANDIRWLASGPRCGLGEVRLPELQPGSSIMPGKVNPVIPEAVIQACARILGNDQTMALGGQGGVLELNLMMPLMGHTLMESLNLLTNAAGALAERCVAGMEADRARCQSMVEQSLAMATYLVPLLGYDRAAQVAKKAHAEGITVREAALAMGVADEKDLERAFRALVPGTGF